MVMVAPRLPLYSERTTWIELMSESNAGKGSGDGRTPIQYGHPMVGVWVCTKCNYESYPNELRRAEAEPPFQCPKCAADLHYDESE